MVTTRSPTKDTKSKASSVDHTDDQEAAVLPSITLTTSTDTLPPQQLAVPTLHQVSSPTPTGFMKLSAELRNEVYQLCLHSNAPIEVQCDFLAGGQPILNMVEPAAGPLHPNLLATCKAIRNEATSILYGSNTFILRRVIGMEGRICSLGELDSANCQLMRQIELRNIQSGDLSSVFQEFGRLHGLKSLVIHESNGGFYDPQAWSKHLAPMMREWSQARSGEDIESLLDIIQFRQRPLPEATRVIRRPSTRPIRRLTLKQFKRRVVAALKVMMKQGQQEFDRQRQLREMLRSYRDDELEQYKAHRALLG
ncbi:hypothetical protein TI39_contig516g00005 [Zymoseptoria brevis]|uniref:Uncharacterized protein n=1 Tax=Zymoseptoria brevis TaxID=1047168 RepID=A0A0F4GIL7_9PEZI|nr:hypothetical protein TI39_contig516g00005 [Zymoseptoria brevis]